jgi:hypothetical protein
MLAVHKGRLLSASNGNDSVRTVIVHYHIFKNAGCSVDRILESSFGDHWATFEGATATSLLCPQDLSIFVKDRPELLAISSHLLRPPAPPDLDVLPIVLIRHPLDRAFSVYSQLRRNNGALLSERIARSTGFAGFVRWCLDNKSLGGIVIANYQVIHLSGASFRSEHIYDAVALESDVQSTVDYLAHNACFGSVERFESVMVRLQQAAEKVGLRFSVTKVAENKTSGRPEALEERLSIARQQLGTALCDRYMRENELDMLLYDWVSSHHKDVRSAILPKSGG